MAFLSRLTLTARLTLLALATLVPLLTLVIIADANERDSRRESAYSEARTYTQSIGTVVDGFARDIDSYMTAASLVIGSNDAPLSTTGPYLRSLKARYETISSLFITDSAGVVVASDSGQGDGTNLSSREYITALQGGRPSVWSGGLSGIQTGELIAVYARTITREDGSPLGFLVAAFRPSNVLQSLPADFPADANLVLVDQNGQLLVSVYEPDLQPGEKNVGDSPHVAPALSGEFVEFHGTTTAMDGDERYGAMAPIPNMGWAIGYSRSQAKLDATLRRNFLGDIAIASVIVILSGTALYLTSRAVTRPLRRLTETAGQVTRGQEAEMPVPGPASDPDVAELQRSFSVMMAEVRDREARLVEQARTLATLEQMGAWIASGLEFEKTLQAVTDAGCRVTEAQFGAFFYNVVDEKGESLQLFTLSGVDRSRFEDFPMPRTTAIFAPTFRGEGPIRSDDITKDPRYGQNSPYEGMPEGHLPVRSYLAVPVVSGTGVTLGGLLFGHEQVGVFEERHERLATGIASWAGIAIDNARMYSEAQKIQEELRKANQSKDEFLGVISHELRTPVTTIYGGLRLLEGRLERLSQEDALDLISSMADEGNRLVRLIENLLAFARIELGRPIDTQPVAVGPLVRHVIENFEHQRPHRVIEATISEDLPPLVLEPTYFEQVLQNLLSNADKYSPPAEPIRVQASEIGGDLCVVVSDNGPGVSADEIGMIFEGFYRSDRTAQQAQGHGLGLTVCKRLVEAQGGRIWARNLEAGGLEVGFAFPAVPAEQMVLT